MFLANLRAPRKSKGFVMVDEITSDDQVTGTQSKVNGKAFKRFELALVAFASIPAGIFWYKVSLTAFLLTVAVAVFVWVGGAILLAKYGDKSEVTWREVFQTVRTIHTKFVRVIILFGLLVGTAASLTTEYVWRGDSSPEIALLRSVKHQLVSIHQSYMRTRKQQFVIKQDDFESSVVKRQEPVIEFVFTRDEAQVLLGISALDLPSRIGIDWSYGDCMDLIDLLQQASPTRDSASIFAEVVRRRACVVSYGPIAQARLKVWAKGTAKDDPSAWPFLSALNAGDEVTF